MIWFSKASAETCLIFQDKSYAINMIMKSLINNRRSKSFPEQLNVISL